MLIERYRASVLEMYRFFVDFFFFSGGLYLLLVGSCSHRLKPRM